MEVATRWMDWASIEHGWGRDYGAESEFHKLMITATPPEWKIDYQAAAEHCHDADYATHAKRLFDCLSDEISWVNYEGIYFPTSTKEVVTGKAVFLFDKEEVHTPPELIETHTYLLKESRVIAAIGISAPAITKRPGSRGFQISNTSEV
jgi:hypothetical protein